MSTFAHPVEVQNSKKCSKCRTKPCKCKKPPRSAAYTVQVTDAEKVCPVCPTIKPHINRNRKPTKCLSACKAFREKPVKERKAIVKSTKACHVCLNQGHFAKDCTRTYKCNKCQGAHNILLCDRAQVNPSRPSSAPSAPPMEEIDADSNFVKSNHGSSYLAVSGAKAIDSRSRVHELTCLWDSGSQLNFILDSTAKLLGFRGEPVHDTSILDRNLFLAFLKDCEMKLANVAARHVNLCTSSGGSKFQKMF